ncbi:MAG: FHA domain-containing protein [Planctomycetota bacterium]|jgi:hypothetical protein
MEFHPRLDAFHEKYGHIEKDDFAAMFQDPFLAFDLHGAPLTAQDFDAHAATSMTTEPAPIIDPDVERLSEIMVAPLDRNEASFLALGRASQNDVVIPHRSISKFHALIEKDANRGTYSIQDAGSKYGTAVGGVQIQKDVPVPLRPNEQIIFSGFVSATFLTPPDFFEFMLRMAKARSRGD